MDTRRQRTRRTIIAVLFLALPVTLNYYSPYLMTQGTAEKVATVSLLFWVTVGVSSLVLGRSFCGWGCPFNGLQTLWDSVAIRPDKRVRFLWLAKYILWAAWVGAVVAIAVVVGGWKTFDPLYMTETGVSVTDPGNMVTYFMLVGLTLAPTLLGRRGFCRYFCPFGVWGIVGEKIGAVLRVPRLRLSVQNTACTRCGSCSRNCPMGLPVREMVAEKKMRATECFMCETCVDVCPQGVIGVGFGAPGPSSAAARGTGVSQRAGAESHLDETGDGS